MALNLSPASEQALVDILLVIRRSFAYTVLVNLVDYGNIVIYAMQHEPPDDCALRKAADEVGRHLRLDFTHIPASLRRLPAVSGEPAGAMS